MKPVEVSYTAKERIKGMITIRNCTQELIDMQLEEYSDVTIKEKQAELSSLYDNFSKKVGVGNTFEMTAVAMESKHLGLYQKSLYLVPNYLTEHRA